MIAFAQPFGLADHSGGGRILRALLEEAPASFLSVCTSPRPPASTPFGQEVHVPHRPFFRWIEGTRLMRPALRAFRLVEWGYDRRFIEELERVFIAHDVTAVHTIPHGIGFWLAFEVATRLGLPYYLNIHDDMRYNLAGNPRLEEAMGRLGEVWWGATGRIVVSKAMGEEYRRRYGTRPYIIATDGLTDSIIEQLPHPTHPTVALSSPAVYFMGSLHLSYHPNFETLFLGMEDLSRSGAATPSLVLRGSAPPFQSAELTVEVRPFAPEPVVAGDFADVDVLYFPLPFGVQHDSLTRYSMSTKLVTYLGSGKPILYHGPAYAAAAQLLDQYGAAVIVSSLEPAAVAAGVVETQERAAELVAAAQLLGRDQFRLSEIRHRFWSMLGAEDNIREEPAGVQFVDIALG